MGPAPRIYFAECILALLEISGQHAPGCLPAFWWTKVIERRALSRKITDPVGQVFLGGWIHANGTIVCSRKLSLQFKTKVGQFLSSSLIRNIGRSDKISFQYPGADGWGKVLIMNPLKGRIGEDNSALLGAMMITKIQLAAMGRLIFQRISEKILSVCWWVPEFCHWLLCEYFVGSQKNII